MANKNMFLKMSSLGIFLGFLSIVPFFASGQTANPLIITWQANNYFPAGYNGKALVTPNTLVIASVELIKNNKLTDTTGTEIRWYLDDKIIASGIGLKTVSFSASQQQSGHQTLKASLRIGNDPFENSSQIRVVQPTVVISFPLPGRAVKAGSQVSLEAIPFFFNVQSLDGLTFNWLINNQRATGRDNRVVMSVGTPQSNFQNSVPISVTVQNSENPYEFNRGSIMLSITK
ncbi:hypothetical protein D4R51_02400 [bacterium]|nr:MAG: hypothetical protein D4R51_02400 [bacterium]